MIYESQYFELENGLGLKAVLSSLGAGIYSLRLDDKPLILECKDRNQYLGSLSYYGKTLGRVAGRIPEEFVLSGKLYKVIGDKDGICLHGNRDLSLSFKNFDGTVEEDEEEKRVVFTIVSEDDDNGFPGELNLKVVYALSKKRNSLKISYQCISSKDTLLNLSNHMYWNLNSKDVNDYIMQVNSTKCGIFKPGCQLVVGIEDVPECLDFKTPCILKDKLDAIERDIPEIGTLDHTFFLDGSDNPAVTLESEDYRLILNTDFDSVNFYVDSSLKPVTFYNSSALTTAVRRAIAIEAENMPLLSNIVLKAGEVYSHYMEFVIDRKR